MHQPLRRVAPPVLALALTLLPAVFAAPVLAAGGARNASPVATPAVLRTIPPPADVASFAAHVPGLRPELLTQALGAAAEARREGLSRSSLLTVIDYTLPSTEPRLWVLDLARQRVLFHELVAHGKNS